MIYLRILLAFTAVFLSSGCALFHPENAWKFVVDQKVSQLGYHNWIVIAEASFPSHSKQGTEQVQAPVEIPEALEYVFQSLGKTENVRPHVYLTRELRSVENNYAPGISDMRKQINRALDGRETTQLDQQSLLTILEDANKKFNVLVIRTQTPLPYSSVFLELQPGYWDKDAESRLRDKIDQERAQKLVPPQ